jgi:hypothetical protein
VPHLRRGLAVPWCGVVSQAVTGRPSDGRALIDRAVAECQNYRTTFGEPIPPQTLAERMAAYMHLFTAYGNARPFGSSIILAGCVACAQFGCFVVVGGGGGCAFGSCAAPGYSQPLLVLLCSMRVCIAPPSPHTHTHQTRSSPTPRPSPSLRYDVETKSHELYMAEPTGEVFVRAGHTLQHAAHVTPHAPSCVP